jgi:hypothetical protein
MHGGVRIFDIGLAPFCSLFIGAAGLSGCSANHSTPAVPLTGKFARRLRPNKPDDTSSRREFEHQNNDNNAGFSSKKSGNRFRMLHFMK